MSQKIELVPISTVMLDPANVRKHPAKNIEGIKASLAEFGQQTPVVIDAKGIVRKGNGTVMAARELGWESIKAIRTDLEGSRAVAYSIADNQHGLTSEWAEVELAETLRALQSEDFNLDAVGFDEAEIDALCEQLGGDILSEQADAPAEGHAAPSKSLAERFVVPPFSILDARQGYWQDRKRAWLALGIQSELGRGGAPGGSPRPAARLTDSGHTTRGDGRGRALDE